MNDNSKITLTFGQLKRLIAESSTSRILQHLTDNGELAIISPYRSERSEKENLNLLRELKSNVRAMKLGFTEMISRWVETNDETGESESSDERSLCIYEIDLERALGLGKKYNQSSIIFKDEKSCREICTTPFTSYDGKDYNYGETVRTFNLSGNKSMNLDDAKEIFSHRKGGPASKPVKGNRAFTLKEMLEVEQPSPSVFSRNERYRKVF